ncbi:MAG: hypothetical protein KDC92_11265 [Bacteroidetes bacterium]|nr:hypothetical protein [Bacteroidota bacterium]
MLISLKFSNPYSIYDSYILVETSDDYGCFNYSISYQSQLVDGVNELIFENILKNGGCQRLVGPATVEIPIDTSQTLNFKMKLKRKWYTGKVENGEISLDNPGRIKLKD